MQLIPPFQGLTVADVRRHYSLAPLALAMGFGGCLMVGNIVRAILYTPDVSFTKRRDVHEDSRYRDVKLVRFADEDFEKLGKAVPHCPEWKKFS